MNITKNDTERLTYRLISESMTQDDFHMLQEILWSYSRSASKFSKEELIGWIRRYEIEVLNDEVWG